MGAANHCNNSSGNTSLPFWSWRYKCVSFGDVLAAPLAEVMVRFRTSTGRWTRDEMRPLRWEGEQEPGDALETPCRGEGGLGFSHGRREEGGGGEGGASPPSPSPLPSEPSALRTLKHIYSGSDILLCISGVLLHAHCLEAPLFWLRPISTYDGIFLFLTLLSTHKTSPLL